MDYDRAADLSRCRSFKFVPAPATYTRGYPSLVTRQIAAAIGDEMAKRGYEPVAAHADLLINFSASLPKGSKSHGTGGYYTYRYYGAWPGYALANELETIDYAPGTLGIDIIDGSRMQLAWEAVAIGAITQTDAAQRQAAIRAAVANMFAGFPFRAAAPARVRSDGH